MSDEKDEAPMTIGYAAQELSDLYTALIGDINTCQRRASWAAELKAGATGEKFGDVFKDSSEIFERMKQAIERLEPVAAVLHACAAHLHEASAKQERDAWQGAAAEVQEEALLCDAD